MSDTSAKDRREALDHGHHSPLDPVADCSRCQERTSATPAMDALRYYQHTIEPQSNEELIASALVELADRVAVISIQKTRIAELEDALRRVYMWVSPPGLKDEDTALVEVRHICREALRIERCEK